MPLVVDELSKYLGRDVVDKIMQEMSKNLDIDGVLVITKAKIIDQTLSGLLEKIKKEVVENDEKQNEEIKQKYSQSWQQYFEVIKQQEIKALQSQEMTAQESKMRELQAQVERKKSELERILSAWDDYIKTLHIVNEKCNVIINDFYQSLLNQINGLDFSYIKDIIGSTDPTQSLRNILLEEVKNCQIINTPITDIHINLNARIDDAINKLCHDHHATADKKENVLTITKDIIKRVVEENPIFKKAKEAQTTRTEISNDIVEATNIRNLALTRLNDAKSIGSFVSVDKLKEINSNLDASLNEPAIAKFKQKKASFAKMMAELSEDSEEKNLPKKSQVDSTIWVKSEREQRNNGKSAEMEKSYEKLNITPSQLNLDKHDISSDNKKMVQDAKSSVKAPTVSANDDKAEDLEPPRMKR